MKRVGYLISILSVCLLAVPSWQKAKEDRLLLACLLAGALTSIIGMSLRWVSYELEQREKQREKTKAAARSDGVQRAGATAAA